MIEIRNSLSFRSDVKAIRFASGRVVWVDAYQFNNVYRRVQASARASYFKAERLPR